MEGRLAEGRGGSREGFALCLQLTRRMRSAQLGLQFG